MVISDLTDYLYAYNDFDDTNDHLTSEKPRENTERWIQDLKAQMVTNGLWDDQYEISTCRIAGAYLSDTAGTVISGCSRMRCSREAIWRVDWR